MSARLPPTSLAALFDAPVTLGQAAYEARHLATLADEEREAITRAVERRRVEFAAGRAAAREALAKQGVLGAVIPRDLATRAPIWPSRYVGSITHTDGWCGAVVARVSDVRAIGLDAEPDAPLEDELAASLLSDEERAREPRPDLRRTFVAKEAFYKAQHPLTGIVLEFTDVAIEWGEDGRYRVACSRVDDVSRGARGVLRVIEGLVVAGCTIA